MKLNQTVNDVVGVAVGLAIVGMVVGLIGTVVVLSYLADTRLFAERV